MIWTMQTRHPCGRLVQADSQDGCYSYGKMIKNDKKTNFSICSPSPDIALFIGQNIFGIVIYAPNF